MISICNLVIATRLFSYLRLVRSTWIKRFISFMKIVRCARQNWSRHIDAKNIIKKLDSERGDIPRSRFLLRMLEKQYLERDMKGGLLDRRIETLQSSKPLSQ
jgi:hypothetical protein